VGPANRR
jgi:hypothetical protein